MPNWVGKMFYYKERPWHGKGVALDHPVVTADGTPIKHRLNTEILRRILTIHSLAFFPSPANLFLVVEVVLDGCLNLFPCQERKLPLNSPY